MAIKIQTSEELDRLFEVLATEIANAHIYYRLFNDLTDSISSHNHDREFEQSSTFWNITLQALQDASLLYLCRVYDKHTDSLNLARLLKTIDKNRSFFSEPNFRKRLAKSPYVDSLAQSNRTPKIDEIAEDITLVDDKNPIVKKLLEWRNNVIAHRKADVVLGRNETPVDNSFSKEEFEKLLTNSLAIITKYSELYRASAPPPVTHGQDDYKYLLHFISLGLQKHDEEMKKQRNNLTRDSRLRGNDKYYD